MNKLENNDMIAPDAGESTSERAIEKIVEKLKSDDERKMRTAKRFYIIYGILVILFLGLFVVNPDSDLDMYDRISGLMYMLGFSIFFYFFRNEYLRLKRIDNTLPVFYMLKNARVRYRFWGRNTLLLFLGMFLIIAGPSFTPTFAINIMPDSWPYYVSVIVVKMIFFLIIIIITIIAMLDWKQKHKAFLNDIDNALNELEENE